MARYFNFKTSKRLEGEARRLGLDLRFDDDLTPLFRPVSVGSLRAGNSMCFQPMEGCDGTLDGTPDELTFRRYKRFGAGGAKMIWIEATAVAEEGRANPRQLWLNVKNATIFERMLVECRQAHRDRFGSDDDLVIGLQLTHSGRYCHQRPVLASHDPRLDPLTFANRSTGRRVDTSYALIEDDSLLRLIEAYTDSARLAYRVGFQFVDIKQCHGYLLNELLGARNRPGKFGGDLFNRTRLAREILIRIRKEVPSLLLGSRLNVFDGVPFRQVADVSQHPNYPKFHPWGSSDNDPTKPDLREPLEWIGEMIRLGVVLVNVTMGNPYTSPHVLRPFEYSPPDGYEPPEHPLVGVDRHFRLAAEIQRNFPSMAVVGSGYSFLQEFLFQAGAANVRDSRISVVGVGRASLACPDFARQLWESGRLDRKQVCRTFSLCTALMRSKNNNMGQFASGCPPFDKEVYGPLWENAKRLKEGVVKTEEGLE